MFIGHYAIGFASRKISTAPSLALMFIAVQLLDLLWPLFVLLGLETFQIEEGITVLTPLNFTHYPYSHSLLMAIFWGVLLGGGYYLKSKNKTGAWILTVLVVSHWVLDLLTHRPDLPLTPFAGAAKVGFGLWDFPIAESILEVGLFAFGAMLYMKTQDGFKKGALWTLILFFLIIHAMNLMGPPPPSIQAVAWSANLQWLFIIWAWWIEKK